MLPIGQHAKPGITTLADKVREVLTTTDISHLKQESSFERSEVTAPQLSPCGNLNWNILLLQSTGNEMTHSSQTNSPRRLTKQIAMELPTDTYVQSNSRTRAAPPQTQGAATATKANETMMNQRQRLRKIGPFAVDSQSIPDSRTKYAGAWPPSYDSDSEPGHCQAKRTSDGKPTNKDELLCLRCSECGAEIEEYSDEEIGIMIIILNTFIHREPALAAVFLPEILTTVSK